MESWEKISLVTMAILSVIIVFILGYSYYLQKNNEKRNQYSILYPFIGYLSPPDGYWTVHSPTNNPGVQDKPEKGLYLTGFTGGEDSNTPQIQCPEGYEINIVSAYIEVNDPYSECDNSINSLFQTSCGKKPLNFMIPCSKDKPCAGGMLCENGYCINKVCTTNKDCASTGDAKNNIRICDSRIGTPCGDPVAGLVCIEGIYHSDPGYGACIACVNSSGIPGTGDQGTCAIFPMCDFSNEKGKNTICYGNRTSVEGDSNIKTKNCLPRDASAYLSKYCNGKNKCLGDENEVWLPNQVENNPFGPLPCHISANSTDVNYNSLPISSGWNGGTPSFTNSNVYDNPSFSQGYYVHGLYSCVLKK